MAAIQSMTGFGRCEEITETHRILVEIKSVNHRYLDLSIKMPRRFGALEAGIRKLVKTYAERGKTDLFIAYESYGGGGGQLRYNEALAESYAAYARRIAERFSLPNDLSVSQLMRMPDVLSLEEESGDDAALWQLLEPAIRAALSDFRRARQEEGEKLREDLLFKLSHMQEAVGEIEAFSPSVVSEYRNRLYEKLRETLSDSGVAADEGRVVTETAIYADKVCTDEEMVRLRSHIAAMQDKLQRGGACGRELDFIAQEMNREANTTLSKANHLKIADRAIALKTEIEKVREQVQNIE